MQVDLIENFDQHSSRSLPYRMPSTGRYNHSAQIKWCEQHFGPRMTLRNTGRWTSIWVTKLNNYVWYFKSEQDYTLFLLRWA